MQETIVRLRSNDEYDLLERDEREREPAGDPTDPRLTATMTLERPRRLDSRPGRRAIRQAGVARRPRGASPDRLGLWAVLMGVFLVLIAASSANAATKLGDRALKGGMEGRDVRHLQLRLKHLGILDAPATAHYGQLTRAAVKRFQRTRCLHVDGIAGPTTISAIRRRAARCHRSHHSQHSRRGGGAAVHPHTATWYGPGLYGSGTACGQTMSTHLVGVAHKTLPCGTRITFRYGSRIRSFRVVDRGPYTKGVVFDLTAAAARSLGMTSTDKLYASV